MIPFDYAALKDLIESRHLTAIESVLPQLPAEFSAGYLLMRDSHSLQAAKPEAPRVILYGSDARLMVAYNADSNYFETIQYDPRGATYEFHRVLFPGKGKPAEFSSTNPAECVVCHTPRFRPNWDAYAKWPGAYGEDDDFPKADELASLKSFFAAPALSERYRVLSRLAGSEASPFETADRGRLRFRPNFRFSAITFGQRADYWARELSEHPRFKDFRALFALSRIGCEGELHTPPAEAIARWFGTDATAPFGPWKKVDAANASAYILRALGITPREWSTAFAFHPEPDLDPYFFHCGLPRDLDNGDTGGVFELSDFVAARIVDKIAPSYSKHYPWIQKRFAKFPEDHDTAILLDDALGIPDWKLIKGACPILKEEYERAASARR